MQVRNILAQKMEIETLLRRTSVAITDIKRALKR